jgi:hypothetical protein
LPNSANDGGCGNLFSNADAQRAASAKAFPRRRRGIGSDVHSVHNIASSSRRAKEVVGGFRPAPRLAPTPRGASASQPPTCIPPPRRKFFFSRQGKRTRLVHASNRLALEALWGVGVRAGPSTRPERPSLTLRVRVPRCDPERVTAIWPAWRAWYSPRDSPETGPWQELASDGSRQADSDEAA